MGLYDPMPRRTAPRLWRTRFLHGSGKRGGLGLYDPLPRRTAPQSVGAPPSGIVTVKRRQWAKRSAVAAHRPATRKEMLRLRPKGKQRRLETI